MQQLIRRARRGLDAMIYGRTPVPPNGPRLNLGCGSELLDGYVNVDLVDERAQVRPDVVCDVRNLQVFDNDHAAEILSVHVIEHFYYWEAKALVTEWVRVLRPGGLMVIETPNLLSACRKLLRNPDRGSASGREGQYTMWVLYGDPGWKDPLMCHRWLYTPQSLAALMRECGLVEVKRTAAAFKKREPRDMRLVGRKPI